MTEMFIWKEIHISGGNQHCLEAQQQQNSDEFQLTLPLEFADDGVQKGVLVRHVTASDGHGSGRGSSGTWATLLRK